MSPYGSNGGAPGAERLLSDAASAARGADDRLSAALIDLFLPEPHRPSDRQRHVMTQYLEKLVDDVEADLRHRLLMLPAEGVPAALIEAIGTARIEIAAPILARANVLRDTALVALLLTRAEEERIVAMLRRAAESGSDTSTDDGSPFEASDAKGARLEMALLIAESRRFDRFNRPAIAAGDLPAEIEHRLVWLVAAALRDYMIRVHAIEPVRADDMIVAAVNAALGAHDEGATIEAAAMRVARHLRKRGLDGDAALVRVLRQGRFTLFVAILAVRARIDHSTAVAMASDPEGARLTVLLRAIGAGNETAAAILLDLAPAGAESRVEDHVANFEALTPDAAIEAIRPWRLDGAYRAAIADLTAGLHAAEAPR